MLKNKTYLFISIDGLTDPLGQSQILPYLTELSKENFKIGIVSCEKPGNFNQNRSFVEGIINKHNIEWDYCFYSSKIPFLSQLKNFFNLKKLTKSFILKNKKLVVLHCRSYLPGLIGLNFKKKYDTGFIFDMRGFWADERIEGNIWNKKNLIHAIAYNYFKRKEKQMLQQADEIISLTQSAKNIIGDWNFGVNPDKITVIPCCVDLNHFSVKNLDPNIKEDFYSKIPDYKNTFVLSYVGSLGTWYMMDEMLLFFKELTKLTNALFLIITKDEKLIIASAAKKLGIDETKIITVSATRNEIPYYINLSKASVFFIRPSFSKQASSPTKMGELLSMGVPIITNSGIGDVDAVIKTNNCGVLINDFTANQYEQAAKKITEELTIYQKNTAATAHNYFSLEQGVKSYLSVYNKFSFN